MWIKYNSFSSDNFIGSECKGNSACTCIPMKRAYDIMTISANDLAHQVIHCIDILPRGLLRTWGCLYEMKMNPITPNILSPHQHNCPGITLFRFFESFQQIVALFRAHGAIVKIKI